MNKKLLFITVLLLLVTGLVFFKKSSYVSQTANTPKVTPLPSPTSFIVFGDSGAGSEEQKKLAGMMLKYNFQFMLHTGDVVYPFGSAKNYQEKFADIYNEHLKQAQFYPSPGNHDYQDDNLKSYIEYFQPPRQALNEADQGKYYSFDKGPIHFISLDTNTPLDQVSKTRIDDMVDWVKQDLEKHKDAMWKIVYFHHPPYTTGAVHGPDYRVRKWLVPLFNENKVDLVFSGHEHNYEFTCMMDGERCPKVGEGRGIDYIVTGGGGGQLYSFDPQFTDHSAGFIFDREEKYHFIYADIVGCRGYLKVIDIKNSVLRSWQINKCN